uniref:Transmembrane domain-containing protein n=1 Tax=Trepomonas sp. PC1 TaxID=1076344 RepID=A0A146K626_9EUKA|eukprot:JAP91344.1 Transmembrane domain-containing protein [Trepomonas sp. PC1]
MRYQFLECLMQIFINLLFAGFYGVILVYASYILTGLDKTNFYFFAPNIQTEIACYADSIRPIMNLNYLQEKSKKFGVWWAFMFFYALQIIIGVIAYWIQRIWMEASYIGATQAQISTSILHHQVISFFICTSLELWSDDKWTKAAPVSKCFILIGCSWLLWFVKNNDVAYYSDLDTYNYFNHFHMVGSLATSIILTNLLWCNIFLDQPWNTYKPFSNPQNRFGNMGSLICIIGIMQWVIVFYIAQLVFHDMDTFMKKCEGTWTLLCFTWHGFTITGSSISPYLWKALDGKMNQSAKWAIYIIICLMFGIIFTSVSYLFYVHVIDDILVRKLGVVKIHEYSNPGYFYAFGAANVPYTYYMMKTWITNHLTHQESDSSLVESQSKPILTQATETPINIK